MGPNYACLFIGYVEQQIHEQYTVFIPHKRYIGNVVGTASCQREELEAFIDFVSNFHPALQFTLTITETELPFLDINLVIISEDRIQTCLLQGNRYSQLPPLLFFLPWSVQACYPLQPVLRLC